ncbi:hypothetical protein CAAN1_15S03180 [[Candida] anglica]|uniref:Uncharacterized protein n=1 Tax=[Candida] anglica TaxID=148631 RepID=A0ABP0E861_9ASCO
MALRNYLYAKHDNNPAMSSQISGAPRAESGDFVATRDKIASLTLEGCHGGDNGECKQCPSCPRRKEREHKAATAAKSIIEVEGGEPVKSREIDYTNVAF